MNTWILRLPKLMSVNLAFLICCLPIVTIGPAMAALHRYMMEQASEEEMPKRTMVYFFQLVKRNFKRDMMIWLGYLAVIIFLLADILLALNADSGFLNGLAYVFGSLLVVVVFSLQYLFPLMARYQESARWFVETSLLMSIKYFGVTVALTLITLAPFAMMYFANLFFFTLLMVLGIIGGAVVVLFQNRVITTRVFNDPSFA